MENKNIIVKLANKHKKNFEGKTPTEIYEMVVGHDGYKQLFNVWSIKEILIFIFLMSTKMDDLSVAYDVIESQMYGYQIIKLIEEDPLVDCDYCEGRGYESCDYCNGDGSTSCESCDVGDIECDDCSASGKDEEGDDCGSCDGRGYNNCEDCNEGYVDCEYCNEGDAECSNCDGGGVVTSLDKIKYDGKLIITYNPKVFKMMGDYYTKVPNNLYDESDSNYNFIISDIESVTDEFNDFKVGDTLLVEIVLGEDLRLRKNYNGRIGSGSFTIN